MSLHIATAAMARHTIAMAVTLALIRIGIALNKTEQSEYTTMVHSTIPLAAGTDDKFFCPVCRKLGDFKPSGQAKRMRAKCRNCGAKERHRLVWLFLSKMTTLFDGNYVRVLHVAPEPAFESRFRALIGDKKYFTADLARTGVDIRLNVSSLPFPAESFDFIYCSHVLEHVQDDRAAIQEFQRVLTIEGVAVLMVPISTLETFEDAAVVDPAERLRLFGRHDHVRRYGPDFNNRLIDAGLSVDVIQATDFLDEDEISRIAIKRNERIYVCRKNRD